MEHDLAHAVGGRIGFDSLDERASDTGLAVGRKYRHPFQLACGSSVWPNSRGRNGAARDARDIMTALAVQIVHLLGLRNALFGDEHFAPNRARRRQVAVVDKNFFPAPSSAHSAIFPGMNRHGNGSIKPRLIEKRNRGGQHDRTLVMRHTKGSVHAPKPDVDFRPGKPSPPPRSARKSASRSGDSGWFNAGLFRIMVFGAIAIGGIAVLLWLRDMGSAAGVNWLN
jgi:hypothetical protein